MEVAPGAERTFVGTNVRRGNAPLVLRKSPDLLSIHEMYKSKVSATEILTP